MYFVNCNVGFIFLTLAETLLAKLEQAQNALAELDKELSGLLSPLQLQGMCQHKIESLNPTF